MRDRWFSAVLSSGERSSSREGHSRHQQKLILSTICMLRGPQRCVCKVHQPVRLLFIAPSSWCRSNISHSRTRHLHARCFAPQATKPACARREKIHIRTTIASVERRLGEKMHVIKRWRCSLEKARISYVHDYVQKIWFPISQPARAACRVAHGRRQLTWHGTPSPQGTTTSEGCRCFDVQTVRW